MNNYRCGTLLRLIVQSAIGLTLLSISSLAESHSTDRCTMFLDASVVDVAKGAIVPHRNVVVRDRQIASVGRSGARTAGCLAINAHGRFLLPGLVDSHVHLFGYSRIGDGDSATQQAIMDLLLAHGVTTALIMEGTPSELRLRQSVADHHALGPRLFVAGPLIQGPNTGALPGRRTFETPADVRREVLDEKRLGYDFVKVHGAMPAETYQALLHQARQSGLRVIGHVPDNLGLQAALDGGQVMIAHAESYLQTYFEFNRDLPTSPLEIEQMTKNAARLTKTAGVYVQPTLSVFRQISDQVETPDKLLNRPELLAIPQSSLCDWYPPHNPYLSHWTNKDLPRFAAQYEVMERLVQALDRAGVPLLVGTDDMVPMQLPGSSMVDEMTSLRRAGLSPASVLRAATSTSAHFLSPGEKNGEVKPGYRADLLLVEDNPLTDLTNIDREVGVMVGGQWLSHSQLQKMLEMDMSRNRGTHSALIHSKSAGPCFVKSN